jgi:hypothetical protein
MDVLFGIEASKYNIILETIYYVIYILGVPLVAYEALRKQRQRYNLDKSRIYTEVNDKYLDFLAIAVHHPRLGLTEHSSEEFNANLDQNEKVQRSILYDMLTSIFERTYLLYIQNEGKDSKEWRTWDLWLDRYIQKKSYVDYLHAYSLNGCFDLDFEAYLSEKIRQFEKRSVGTAINQKEEV